MKLKLILVNNLKKKKKLTNNLFFFVFANEIDLKFPSLYGHTCTKVGHFLVIFGGVAGK